MDGDIVSGLLLILVEDVVDLLYGLVVTSVCAAENDEYTCTV